MSWFGVMCEDPVLVRRIMVRVNAKLVEKRILDDLNLMEVDE